MSDANGGNSAKRTTEMGVDNTGFIVERLGRDCGPLQYIRELTQNSIEAVLDQPDQSGEIHWDVDWDRYDLTGQYKLAISDTGVGMTGEEMLLYINHLSASGHEQGHDKNFGVGAKVAAATRNHAGLVYLSWKGGTGYMTHLWRDPQTDQYGVARVQRNDDSYADFVRVADDVKPDNIKDSGTKVVLLGMNDDHNTVEPPEGVEGRQRWITKYLNTRYFDFPDGVEVTVREGYQAPRDDSKRNFRRRVTGMRKFLEEESDWCGEVPLTGATAHVWILGDRPERVKQGDMFATTGHMAALYQGELYEMVGGRGGVARLQQFGVIFGHNRVVIYIEPDLDEDRLSSNTARTQLLYDGEPLPWAEWAGEFRENMPGEVEVLMEEITAGTSATDHKQAIRERLRPILSLFRNLSRYRRTSGGPVKVSGDTPGGKSAPEPTIRNGTARSGGRGGRAGDIYALFVDEGGDAAETVASDPMPEVRWISEKHDPPTRTPDLLEDRAAKYLPEQNLLQINADFRVFTDMIGRWCAAYANVPGAHGTVEEVVQEWFEQALVETVLGAQSLQGSPQWTIEDIGKLWSEEALSAAVLQRYHIDVNVKRTLGSKLGTLREKVVA